MEFSRVYIDHAWLNPHCSQSDLSFDWTHLESLWSFITAIFTTIFKQTPEWTRKGNQRIIQKSEMEPNGQKDLIPIFQENASPKSFLTYNPPQAQEPMEDLFEFLGPPNPTEPVLTQSNLKKQDLPKQKEIVRFPIAQKNLPKEKKQSEPKYNRIPTLCLKAQQKSHDSKKISVPLWIQEQTKTDRYLDEEHGMIFSMEIKAGTKRLYGCGEIITDSQSSI